MTLHLEVDKQKPVDKQMQWILHSYNSDTTQVIILKTYKFKHRPVKLTSGFTSGKGIMWLHICYVFIWNVFMWHIFLWHVMTNFYVSGYLRCLCLPNTRQSLFELEICWHSSKIFVDRDIELFQIYLLKIKTFDVYTKILLECQQISSSNKDCFVKSDK